MARLIAVAAGESILSWLGAITSTMSKLVAVYALDFDFIAILLPFLLAKLG
jgi:hypothetical protein